MKNYNNFAELWADQSGIKNGLSVFNIESSDFDRNMSQESINFLRYLCSTQRFRYDDMWDFAADIVKTCKNTKNDSLTNITRNKLFSALDKWIQDTGIQEVCGRFPCCYVNRLWDMLECQMIRRAEYQRDGEAALWLATCSGLGEYGHWLRRAVALGNDEARSLLAEEERLLAEENNRRGYDPDNYDDYDDLDDYDDDDYDYEDDDEDYDDEDERNNLEEL